MLSDDAANVFLTLTARDLNPRVYIVARAENPTTEKKLLRSGANRVVLPTAIGASKIADLIMRPSAEGLLANEAGRQSLREDLEQVGLRMQEFVVGKTSRLARQQITNIETKSYGGYLIIAVQRFGGPMLRRPPADTVVNIGDTIIVLGHPASLETLAFKASPTSMTARGHGH